MLTSRRTSEWYDFSGLSAPVCSRPQGAGSGARAPSLWSVCFAVGAEGSFGPCKRNVVPAPRWTLTATSPGFLTILLRWSPIPVPGTLIPVQLLEDLEDARGVSGLPAGPLSLTAPCAFASRRKSKTIRPSGLLMNLTALSSRFLEDLSQLGWGSPADGREGGRDFKVGFRGRRSQPDVLDERIEGDVLLLSLRGPDQLHVGRALRPRGHAFWRWVRSFSNSSIPPGPRLFA